MTLGSYEDVTKKNVVIKESDKAANSRAILLNKDVKSDGSQTVKSAMVRGIMDAGDLVKTKDSSGNEISWDIQHVNLGLVNPTKVKISKRAQKTDVKAGGVLANAKMEIRDEKDNIIDSYTSTASVHIADLQAGKTYTIIETNAPDGYGIADPKTFTLVDADGNILVNNTVDVKGNTVKVMWDAGSKLEILKKNLLSWDPIELTDATGSAMKNADNSAMTSYLTSGVGNSFRLDNGTYKVHEVSSAYANAIDDCEFIVDGKEGSYTVQRKLGKNDAINIEDPVKIVPVKFNGKVDRNNKMLYGAVLQIKHDNKVLYEWTSSNASPQFDLYADATYTLHEKTAPLGYALADDIEFSIKPNGSITARNDDNREEQVIKSLTMVDGILRKNVRIWKVRRNSSCRYSAGDVER